MIIIESFFWLIGALLLSIVGYLWFLAAASFLPEKKRVKPREPRTKFAILVPAHNESGVIECTLRSVEKLDYPSALFETVVIADNCSDHTASVALSHGVTVLERHDEERRGKGYALQWAFRELREEGRFDDFDAFVVIDADTIFERSFLKAMDARIVGGETAVQGYYDVLDPAGSPMASLSYLGFALNRNLKYRGRTKLGWSGNLLGNGMCFAGDVIRRFGWNATSIVEDMEYAVMLRLGGVAVCFAPEARVYAAIPDTFRASRIQRSRWDIGRFQVRNKYIKKLFKAGVKNREVGYLDTAMELLVPPFSLFVTFSFLLFGLFLAIGRSDFGVLSRVWFTIALALSAYIVLGLITARANWKTYMNLLYAPFFLAWRVGTIAWGYVHKIGGEWIKTERKNIL